MIYVHWLILLTYTVVVLAAMVKVLMDNRQPVKALTWILVLCFIPVLGMVFYFFFGQNTRKERLISQRSLNQLTKRSMLEFAEQRDLTLPPSHEALITLFANQNWALPFKDNQAEIYTDGYAFFTALLQEIGRARSHIHLISYIFADDALGRLVADALMDKAKAGVEVRVVYDDVGCWNISNRIFEDMRRMCTPSCLSSFLPLPVRSITATTASSVSSTGVWVLSAA